MSEQAMWELMELEAKEKFFLNRPKEGFFAEKPGIIIASGPFTAPDAKRGEFYTVYFGPGIAHWNFKNLTQAEQKVREILATANKPIQVIVEDRDGKRKPFS